MGDDRHLDWDGCANVRDLGDLRTGDGRVTRRGAVVRADALDRLTAAGWAALRAHSVRTVIDLRNPGEHASDAAARPADVSAHEVVLATLAALDVEAHLREGGLDDDDVATLRERLLEPAP